MSKENKTELKPCPFCGSGNVNYFPQENEPTTKWDVNCFACGASTRMRDTRELAAQYWNTRSLKSAELEAEVLRLRRALTALEDEAFRVADAQPDLIYLKRAVEKAKQVLEETK